MKSIQFTTKDLVNKKHYWAVLYHWTDTPEFSHELPFKTREEARTGKKQFKNTSSLVVEGIYKVLEKTYKDNRIILKSMVKSH